MLLEGARAIITGAGAGLGKALCARLLGAGGKVVAFDNCLERLTALQQEFRGITPVLCDVSDNDQVERAVDEAYRALGGLEILVNNAGIMKNAPLINLLQRPDRRHSVDLWRQVIAVNQDAVFFMTRAVADRMVAGRHRGVIVNISSICARGNIGQTAYSASKAAVEAMTAVWAKELGSFGIRSVAVAPGFIDTTGMAAAVEGPVLSQWIARTPLRRLGATEEVIEAIVLAIGNDFMTGNVLAVDGGLSL